MRRQFPELVQGAVAGVALFVAVPIALSTLVGLPIPAHWAPSYLVSTEGLLDLLAIAAWVAWVACCIPLVRSIASRVRRRDVAAGSGARLADRLAARMAALILVIGSFFALANDTTGIAGATEVHRTDHQSSGQSLRALSADRAPHSGSVDLAELSYTVKPGDSLWSIAQNLYGDGADWQALASVNLGAMMTADQRFLDPNVILPGWILRLPEYGDLSRSPLDESSSDGLGDVDGLGETAVVKSSQSTLVHPKTALAPPKRPRDSLAGDRGSHHESESSEGSGSGSGHFPLPLPELAALGLGALGAAATAKRILNRRSYGNRTRGPGLGDEPRLDDRRSARVSDLAADTAVLLSRVNNVPLLDWLDAANRHLSAVLGEIGPLEELPKARMVRAGINGIEIMFCDKVTWAPRGWKLADSDFAWCLCPDVDLSNLQAAGWNHQPWFPVLFPVGETSSGSWLVPLAPGDRLAVVGAQAEQFITASKMAMEAWPWAHRVFMTNDPTAASDTASLICGSSAKMREKRLVFFGEVSEIAKPWRSMYSIVTPSAADTTDLVIVVDERVATIHPLGATLRPSRMSSRRASALAELIDSEPDEVLSPIAPVLPEPFSRDPSFSQPVADELSRLDHLVPNDVPADVAVPSSASLASPPVIRPSVAGSMGEIEPGDIDVRLLTTVPRIDGLSVPLPAKQARRAIELVAYMALHQPHPVTSDRLRTRVLGSPDSDAAAKTLFNTVGAARRALGIDPRGHPYLPPAAKSGHYRISESVTIDVIRAHNLVQTARLVPSSQDAIALYRAAFELIEGEPLGAVLSGYSWWRAEGHEARITATIVEAACHLTKLAIDSSLLDLARWALDRARLVDPYSESLSRAAMELAAATGDVATLRREWMECQRKLDELDPGCLPSATTERLFEELSRRSPIVTT